MKLSLGCNRCGYTWVSRKKHPLTCPSCRNRYWDKPRKMKYKVDEQVSTIENDVQIVKGVKL